MPAQLWFISELSAKSYRRSIWYRLNNMRTTLPKFSEFSYDNILKLSLEYAKLSADRFPATTSATATSTTTTTTGRMGTLAVPDEEWWKKLCAAVQVKHPQLSRYGAKLLQEKLVRTLGGRLLFEDLYARHREEIERFVVHEPIYVLGLPRTNCAMASHMLARSGIVWGLRNRDTIFPGVPSEMEREALAQKFLRDVPRVHPQLHSVAQWGTDLPTNDVFLNLMNPRALAWGLLHGLPDYLYECLQEDQEHVFDFTQRVLKVFLWYNQCREFSTCVPREHNQIETSQVEVARYGQRLNLSKRPFVVHSPFALLHIAAAHKVFPDMRIIWCHRALSQCVGSMCGAFALHNSVYTGVSPSSSQLAQIGEQVCGIFGSGSEHAIDYLADFPMARMVHWHNRDIARSGVRLVTKTLDYFNIDSDHYHNQQAICGNSEYVASFRPKLDTELAHFGLHEGIIGEYFQAYTHQFEAYAYEPKFGIKMQDYVMLSTNYNMQRFAQGDSPRKLRQTSFSMLAPPGQAGAADGQNQTALGGTAIINPHD